MYSEDKPAVVDAIHGALVKPGSASDTDYLRELLLQAKKALEEKLRGGELVRRIDALFIEDVRKPPPTYGSVTAAKYRTMELQRNEAWAENEYLREILAECAAAARLKWPQVEHAAAEVLAKLPQEIVAGRKDAYRRGAWETREKVAAVCADLAASGFTSEKVAAVVKNMPLST